MMYEALLTPRMFPEMMAVMPPRKEPSALARTLNQTIESRQGLVSIALTIARESTERLTGPIGLNPKWFTKPCHSQ